MSTKTTKQQKPSTAAATPKTANNNNKTANNQTNPKGASKTSTTTSTTTTTTTTVQRIEHFSGRDAIDNQAKQAKFTGLCQALRFLGDQVVKTRLLSTKRWFEAKEFLTSIVTTGPALDKLNADRFQTLVRDIEAEVTGMLSELNCN